MDLLGVLERVAEPRVTTVELDAGVGLDLIVIKELVEELSGIVLSVEVGLCCIVDRVVVRSVVELDEDVSVIDRIVGRCWLEEGTVEIVEVGLTVVALDEEIGVVDLRVGVC